jgi:hypothetical protein
MSSEEQERYAAAVLKMRENDDGIPGSSQYFKLAVVHGGMHPLDATKYPEFCAHRRECFPGWHRPYMLEFERAMRRADIALGGDGNIGLPYWDWTDIEVNGEVLPGILRRRLMEEFPEDFFGDEGKIVTPDPGRHGYKMSGTRSDARIKSMLSRGSVADAAAKCLHSLRHEQHATTAFSDNRFPSIETPHNNIHGYVSGIMASFQSSFHPAFWLHHCNIDRIYEKYIQLEPDSSKEFMEHQAQLDPQPAAGFPEGPWGPYEPFIHHKTGAKFHARDCFDAPALGFRYDDLPSVQPPQMREPPFFAVFREVDIQKLVHPRLLYVYVAGKDDKWVRPEGELTEAPGYAGAASVFFFDTPGGCANCKINPKVDLYVDITQALREANLRPPKAALHVLVEDANGQIELLEDTPVPPPQLKGPRFSSMAEMLAQGAMPGDDAGDDVKVLQEMLIKNGVTDAETVGGDFGSPDGNFGPMTDAAVKKLQAAAGITVDGIAGPQTKTTLLTKGLQDDGPPEGERLKVAPAGTATWSLELKNFPKHLDKNKAVAELQAAFDQWGEAIGAKFAPAADGTVADVAISWARKDCDGSFDGPGGCLASATSSAVVFDMGERWELQDVKHPHRAFMDWDEQYFKLLPVALHEIGHVLGLSHSSDPFDVMSPYYLHDRIKLSMKDIERVRAIVAA